MVRSRRPRFHVRTLTPSFLRTAEILDFGYPQNSESDTLKMYITTEGVKSEQAVVRLPSSPPSSYC
jgi:hypothetical protein